MKKKPILENIVKKLREDKEYGIFSICSSNEFVLITAIELAKKYKKSLLIETTANQVNQYGGYTGLKPADFSKYCKNLALKIGLPEEMLILGGDHLGPMVWKSLGENEAMLKAEELIRQYIYAGFQKIHLDTSMLLSSDKASGLSNEVIAKRSIRLCKIAEEVYHEVNKSNPEAQKPFYVIGSETPIAGGSQENESKIHVTKPGDCRTTIEIFYKEFESSNMLEVWERVMGIVIQPGVEFSDKNIFEYAGESAEKLIKVLQDYPNLVFEGHSTDYQTKNALKQMVSNRIAILKVGPALTFALREALFSLELIEIELIKRGLTIQPSFFRNTLEKTMIEEPSNWIKYYKGDAAEQQHARAFSLSDRARYYLDKPSVKISIKKLINNLNNTEIPYPLLSQFLPTQYKKIREYLIRNNVEVIIKDKIAECIEDYIYACNY